MSLTYVQYPTIRGDKIVFVYEESLWQSEVGHPSHVVRLTAPLEGCCAPSLSKDGKSIIFTAQQGRSKEVFLLDLKEGTPRQLTFLGGTALALGWHPNGKILFSSNHDALFSHTKIYTLDPDTHAIEELPVGSAVAITYGAQGRCVIQLWGYGYVAWKGYQGGKAGQLWIEKEDQRGIFERLVSLKSNALYPQWVGDRIYFVSDHQERGQVCSVHMDGSDLKIHTSHNDFYPRFLSSDGHRLVYKCGGRVWMYDPNTQDLAQILPLEVVRSSTFSAQRYLDPQSQLSSYAPQDQGQMVAIAARGRLWTMTPWRRGPVTALGEKDGVRYRLLTWLAPKKPAEKETSTEPKEDASKTEQGSSTSSASSKSHLAVIKDEGRKEYICLFEENVVTPYQVYGDEEWGRITSLIASPVRKEAVFTNHRHELWHIDLETGQGVKWDKSQYGPITGVTWSDDGEWVAYSCPITHALSIIRTIERSSMRKIDITRPKGKDFSPSFDPEGKYLFFLSARIFDPAWDALLFDVHFHSAVKPYVVSLRKSVPSLLTPLAEEFSSQEKDAPEKEKIQASADAPRPQETAPSQDQKLLEPADKETAEKKLQIDEDGLWTRLEALPVSGGDYGRLVALKGKKVLYSFREEHQSREDGSDESMHERGYDLKVYDFSLLKEDSIASRVDHFRLSLQRDWMMYSVDKRLRCVRAGERGDDQDMSFRAGGWISWDRIRLSVDPRAEWRQMFDEAWRLQKEMFWREDMGGVDWEEVYARYRPLVEHVSSQSEFYDILAEMQGELKTSHAYIYPVFPEDKKPIPGQGYLGVKGAFDETVGAFRVSFIHKGEGEDGLTRSPLAGPGIQLQEGDLIWSIMGRPITRECPLEKLLAGQAGNSVQVEISNSEGQERRRVLVTLLRSVKPCIYRTWVNKNRDYVHKKSQGRIGYIHIPDMGELGFAEFSQGYLQEHHREGLIIDVRDNLGGNVSTLILEKLMRQRFAYDHSRWLAPLPYMMEAPAGPMVALCNQGTSSDGDIFCFSFKHLKLGRLIGTRTWGGVVGIWPKHPLLDGTVTTQPEYAFWFEGIEWGLENHGVDPDEECEILPHEAAQGKDPQLDRGIEEVLKSLA